MESKSKIIICILFLVCLVYWCEAEVNDGSTLWTQQYSSIGVNSIGNFSFLISMPKDTFLECQPIHVILKINNIRNQEDSLQTIIDYEDIAITNESTNEKLRPVNIWDYFRIPIVHFEPYEEKAFDFEITWEFGNARLVTGVNKSGAEYGALNYIPSGKYTIVFGKNGIISNKLNFEILKPYGEDLNELNELSIAYMNLDERYQIDKLYDFLSKYPESKYTERGLFTYQLYVQYFTLNDCTNLILLADKWFEKDTESEFAKTLVNSLWNLTRANNSDVKSRSKEYLIRITTEHPRTKISKWSEEYLIKF